MASGDFDSDRIIVFAGPTLHGVRLGQPFIKLPPAGAGDALRLLNGRPCTVVLIDGVFDERPSVWHKELLLLMSRDFRLVGAASMGALRAAELARFGMTGVGAVFEAYARGRLTADDEVAVAHAEEAHDYKPFTLPQVNVRATLRRLCRFGLLPVEQARAIRDLSAGLHYRDRVWRSVLSLADEAGVPVPPDVAAALPRLAVDLKRMDADIALGAALDLARSPAPPPAIEAPPITHFIRRLAKGLDVGLPPPEGLPDS